LSAVADVGYIALVVAGLGAYWWRHLRQRPHDTAARELFAPDAEVALHVALHEATARHQRLSSLHLLYGLLQDEAVTEAIATAGGDPAQLEDLVLAALDERSEAKGGGAPSASAGEAGDNAPRGRDEPAHDIPDHGGGLAGRAAAIARHTGRRATCTDLWASLGGSPAAELLDAAKLDRGGTLFALFHGGRAPEIALPDQRDVRVVLRNDHYTTQQFVCGLLRDVFALSEAEASAIMLATHTTGRAVIGRYTAAAARDKIARTRALARAQAFPLWIGVEPA
jgi:ATP-dependent Clp protease adaptor protein ClpS